MNKRISVNKRNRIIFALLLGIFVIAYNLIFINRNFTMSEGWAFFYSNLISQGKVPYRDFYYFLPPLNLLIDYIIWKLSNGLFIVYRFIRLAERVAIVEIMYYIISEKVDYMISMLSCFAGAVLGAATMYDLMGDYNQTMVLLCAVMCLLVCKYTENFENLKKRYIIMFMIGVCGGFMALCKQTIVVSTAIIFALLILFLAAIKIEKNLMTMIIAVFSGFTIPAGITLIYCLITHSLSDFINQVFIDMDSKGSLISVIIGSILKVAYYNKECIVAVVLIISVIYIYKYRNSVKITDKYNNILCITLLLLAMAIIIFFNYKDFTKIIAVLSGHVFTLLLLIAFIVIIISNTKRFFGIFMIVLSYVMIISLVVINFKNISTELSEYSTANAQVQKLLTWLFFAIAFWLVVQVIKYFTVDKNIPLDSMVIASTTIALGWSLSMAASAAYIGNFTGFIIFPAVAYILFKNKKINHKYINKVVSIVCLIIICFCTYERVLIPYSWWGYTSSPIAQQKYTSDIKAIKAFTFNEEELHKFDTLTKIIKDNTDKNSVIFGFPYAKVYNVLTDNYNMDNFVPVLFYDVCSSSYARSDAVILAENEPDIVVWHDIENCLEIHEKIYKNNAQLGQRDIIKWFADVKDEHYVLIGQVDNIFVYKNKNSGKPSSTYIEDISRVNITAQKDYLTTVVK